MGAHVASANTDSTPHHDCPDSLKQRGAAYIDLHDEAGITPCVRRTGFHLRSGQVYTLRIRPQQSGDSGSETKVTITAGDPLRVLVPAPDALPPHSHEYTCLFQPRLVRPYPTKTDLTVNLSHKRWGPFLMTIPVVVWPSKVKLLLWGLGLWVSFVLGKCGALWVEGGHSLRESVTSTFQDLDFLLEAGTIPIGLWILSRVVSGVWITIIESE